MNKKNKLAIIGANSAITILIEKAKTLGYETHVFAWACGDPGEKAADHFYPISIADRTAILEKCREIGVCGVCSITSDFAAPVVSFVARELGLTCNPPETEILARNKFEMRNAFKNADLFCPKFIKADEGLDVDELKDFKFPVIVKPTDAWSSKGITRVDEKAGLIDAIRYAASFSTEKKAIVEEFIDGPEYSAECICYNGKYDILTFTQKETTGFPHYIETGHVQPSDIPEDKQEEIRQFLYKALAALKIQNGAAHAEFRLTEDGNIGIMEIGARMGGDNIGTHLTPISTGKDFVRMVIDVACGNAPDLTIVSEPTPVRTKFIMNEKDVFDFNELASKAPSRIICKSVFDEDCSKPATNSGDRHGFYIYKL